MSRICFDYGHGGSDPGATYKKRVESVDNLKVGMRVAAKLRSHGIIVDETRTDDSTMSLSERSQFERRQNYDYFISFHRNAYIPETASGVETFTYIEPNDKAISLAQKIQEALVGIGYIDRGVKKANFHVLRETNAPAVLIEIGFIDNTKDNALFDSKIDEIVEDIARAILSQLGVAYQETLTFYRVMVGSFKEKENAQRQTERLNTAGFDVVIMPFKR